MKKLIATIACSGLLIAGFLFAQNSAVVDSAAFEVEPGILSVDGPESNA
ncbi:hypothetical protein ACFFIS_15555 [Virgibacillus soli]|uniref:Uncharacterized protein n=1 Tax=Paracerasibacillus soli TaxID=480284 RepID=A0ABU5CYP5_9BACI|nr:hypothetical protein [Virgibacillus soli]MDY0410590.1 hypothetical protein [Virgibacillus soli]